MTKMRCERKPIFALLVFQTVIYTQQDKCAVVELSHLTDTIWVYKHDFVNLTFWLNSSGCKPSDTLYRLTVKVKTDNNITDDDGRVAVINGTCDVTTGQLLRCVSAAGPVELYRKVNTSTIDIEWKWWWKENGLYTYRNKTLHVQIYDPPTVTNLTVNGQKVNGTFISEVSQNMSIFCAFTKGNPPTTFRLLDGKGDEIVIAREETHIIHSLAAASCEEDWPVVRCEGQRSTENRSVSLLVRCPPQFTDVSPKFINHDLTDHVILNIKAHSTIVNGCLLTTASSAETTRRQVNCRLHGIPPNLTLTILLQDKDKLTRGNWTLIVTNEIGTGEIVLTFFSLSGDDLQFKVVTGGLSGVAVLTVTVFAILRVRKHKHKYTSSPHNLKYSMYQEQSHWSVSSHSEELKSMAQTATCGHSNGLQ